MSEYNINTDYKLAAFAGGCFWCMEAPFKRVKGVLDVRSGYTGGNVENPTYEEVCTQLTGHYEAVEVAYDPLLVSYEELLEVFWKQIDPTDEGGQFYDRGPSYRTAIFYYSEEQRIEAEASKAALGASGRFKKPIVTEIKKASIFYPAEGYHQNYYKKNPTRYEMYKKGSGRDAFIKKYWGEE